MRRFCRVFLVCAFGISAAPSCVTDIETGDCRDVDDACEAGQTCAEQPEGWRCVDATTGPGHIYFVTQGEQGRSFRVEASDGAAPVDVGDMLRSATPDCDEASGLWQVTPTPDGQQLVVQIEEGGCFADECPTEPCLGVSQLSASGQPGPMELVRVDHELVHPYEDLFVGQEADGELLVGWVPDRSRVELIRLGSDGLWASLPPIDPEQGEHSFYSQPSFCPDARTLLVSCGDDATDPQGNDICALSLAGEELEVLLDSAINPVEGRQQDGGLQFPSCESDWVLFQSDWDGDQQIWRSARSPEATGPPERVHSAAYNDKAPCLLSDGRIVSAYYDKDGSDVSVIKVLDPDDPGAAPICLALRAVDFDDGFDRNVASYDLNCAP